MDRGEYSFEGGLTLEKLPALTFKYSHRYRNGDKSSTIWGPEHPDLFVNPTLVQGLAPGFYNLDEKIDTFELDAKQHIKATDLALGLRYETADLNNALYTTRFLNDPIPPSAPYVTDQQKTTYDLFNVNASSETWIKPNLMFSAGFMFANLDNDLSGNRIYGSEFNASYLPSPSSGYGYTNLIGDSHMKEYVLDLNLMSIPIKTVTIVPAIRVQKETWDANSSGGSTLSVFPPDSFSGQSSRDVIDVSESLDTRYTGITNWVFSVRGEWEEGQGSLTQSGGLTQVDGIGAPYSRSRARLMTAVSFRNTPSACAGIRSAASRSTWVVITRTTSTTTTIRRIAAANDFSMQSFETYDVNTRVTWRPVQNVTLVGRYEYQYSTVNTQPDPASGLGGVESSKMTSHIIAGDASWTPWSRLSLQAGIDYVLSETKTPVTDYTTAILNSQNNYWTVNFSSDFVVDDKTDLDVAYFYYRADDYQDNSNAGLAVGAGAYEHGVTATLTRRITQHLKASLKYSYYNYEDAASGGFNNFEAHLIFASLQYRF